MKAAGLALAFHLSGIFFADLVIFGLKRPKRFVLLNVFGGLSAQTAGLLKDLGVLGQYLREIGPDACGTAIGQF